MLSCWFSCQFVDRIGDGREPFGCSHAPKGHPSHGLPCPADREEQKRVVDHVAPDVRTDFDVATLLDLGRWERYRSTVQHPTTLFAAPEIENARTAATQTDWGQRFQFHFDSVISTL